MLGYELPALVQWSNFKGCYLDLQLATVITPFPSILAFKIIYFNSTNFKMCINDTSFQEDDTSVKIKLRVN